MYIIFNKKAIIKLINKDNKLLIKGDLDNNSSLRLRFNLGEVNLIKI